MAANGRIPTAQLAALPKVFSNKRETEHLTTAAYASLVRMMLRATADTGSFFSIWDAYRSLTEQVAMLERNYTRVSRGRTRSSDRSYGGSTWAKKSGRPLTASPGHSNHGNGLAIDIHPAAIQAWMRGNANRFGWVNDVPSEPWHWSYLNPGRDQYRSEGLPDVAAMQRALGVGADGKPGPGTASAIRAFQQQRRLTVDGIAGPTTMSAILGKGDAAPVIPAIPAGGTSVPAPSAPARTELEAAVEGIFPWADSSTQFWDETFPDQTYQGGEPIGLLHSTETGTWPGYQGGASAPHLTVRFDPTTRTATARQHYSTTRPSRALVNKSGGVQTNNQRVFQIELIGSCDRAFATKHGYLYLPDLLTEPWARDALAGILAAVSESLCIPLTTSVTWARYPGSYGERAAQRLSGEAWEEYTGWLGHQHAPENTHGDPGDIPIEAVLTAAAGGASAPVVPPTAPSTPPSTLPTGKALLMALIDAPDFPLLRTPGARCYYGDASGPVESVSGKSANSLHPGEIVDGGAQGLRTWQRQMNARGYSLSVDGRYGPATDKACRNLQRLAGITQDGKIGPDAWHAAWLLPVQ